MAQVSVTATAGTLGPTPYTTLKLAFDAVNAGTHQGAVTIDITASTTEGTTPATLNSNGAGAALYTSILIRPTADGVSISGNPALGFGVIQLKGADNVTIDGDNPNSAGTNRNLTIANTAVATTTLNAAIRIATAATVVTNADNITIKNCIINGSATGRNLSTATSTTGSENTSFGIYVGGNGGATATDAPTALTSVTTNTAPSGTTVNALIIDNNSVNQCARGIVFNGAATTVSTGVTITNNLVGDQATNNVGGTPPYTSPSTTVYTKGIIVQGTSAVTITGNTVKNLLSYVGTAMNAIELTTAIGATVNVNNNTVTTVCQNVAANAVRGILVSSSAGPTTNVNGNTLSNLNIVGGSSVGGIDVNYSGTTTGSVSKNSIATVRNRNAGGFGASGIRVSGGSGWNINDNCIVEVLNVGTASFTGTFNCMGIKLASGSNHKIYHNSVNLFGASTSTGSNAIGCLEISAASQTGIDVRNNLLSNKVTGGNAAEAIVCLFTPFANAAMTLTQNNNAYFSTVGAQQGIAFAGASSFAAANLFTAANFNPGANTPATNYRSVSTVLGSATNDNASFASTTAAPITSNTDLHIPAATSTQLESGGAAGLGITTDFDGETFGSLGSAFAPDIGYDEFAGAALDIVPPAITYTPLANTCLTSARTLTTTITDVSGVPTAGAGLPVLYWNINAGAYTSTAATFGGGSSYSFSFGAGVSVGDVVSYYIVAQDNAGTPNVGSQPSGASGFTINPPAASTPPASPSTYTIQSTLAAGTYSIPGAYATLTAAVNDYNTKCLGGPIVFELAAGYSSVSETFPITVNANADASAVNTLTVRPAAGTTQTITGSSATALLILNGADFVTLDGSNGNTPNTVCPVSTASRDLTITNTNTSTASAVVWLQTTAGNGATSNTIRNCNLVGNSNTTTLFGVGAGSTTISTTSLGTGNNNNAFVNNNISKTQYGIYSQGASAANKNAGTVINQNLINTVSPNNVAKGGVFVGFENNITISGNRISEIAQTSSPDVFGITLGTTSISSSTFTGNEVTGATISKNVIGSIRNTGTFSACGIFVAPATSGINEVSNNMISGVSANGTSGDISVGIMIGGGTGSTTRVYYNTVYMNSTPANTGASDKSYALAIGGSNPAVDVKNNILVNTQNNGSGNNYAIAYGYSTFTNLLSDHNDYFVAAGATFFIGGTGSLSAPTNQTTVLNLQTATGMDGFAQNALPSFASLTNLHLNGSGNGPLNASATPVSVTDDIDCETRDVVTPDIGADEFTPCTPPSSTVAPAGPIALCSPGTELLTSSTNAATPTYQWAKDGIDIGGATSSTLTVSAAGSYTVRITDTTTSCANTSNAVVVTVNIPPTVTASATPPSICPGGSSQLSAVASNAIGLNYSMTPLTGQTYTTLTGGGITVINTAVDLTAGFGDGTQDDGGVLITLPFTFTYLGNTFTQMSMSTNGWVGAGNQTTVSAANGRTPGNLFTTTVPNNTIAAWFRDMGANFPLGTGSMRHGSIGTDVYAFQWDNAVGSGFSDGSTILISFQINIHGPASATPGRIEMIYGPTVGVIAVGASVGIENATGGTNNYLNALTGNGTSTTTSSAWPGDGNGYRFDPAAFTYSWSPVTFLDNPSIANPLATGVTTTTIYTVTATATATGCTNTANATVTVFDPPVCSITASPAATVCDGTTVTLDAGVGFSYLWNTGATTQTIQVTTSGGYSVTVTDGNGCTNTCNILVTVNPNPTCAITGPTPVCSGTTNSYSGTAGMSSYAWSISSGNGSIVGASDQPSVNVLAGALGTYTLQLTIIDGNGCTSTCSKIVDVYASPTIQSQPVGGAVGYGSPYTFTVGATGGALSYQWYLDGNLLVDGGTISGATTATLSISSTIRQDSGLYTVVVTNICGTITSEPAYLEVNGNATVSLVTQPCVNTNQLVVDVFMSSSTSVVVGGQFFLAYNNTVLDFVSAIPGDAPFVREVYEAVNETAGEIDYAVGIADDDGIPPPEEGTSANTVMARLTFNILQNVCTLTPNLVTWRPSGPNGAVSKLSNSMGIQVNINPVNLGNTKLDNIAPVITVCPSNITVHAAAGTCSSAPVTYAAVATDNCTLSPTITFNPPSGSTFPPGTWPVLVTATDECGNFSTCTFNVTNDGQTQISVDVELGGGVMANGAFTRGITFALWNTGVDNVNPLFTTCVTMNFSGDFPTPKTATATFLAPCQPTGYTCITARDRLHTLRRTISPIPISGPVYAPSFTGAKALIGGNLDDSKFIDIVDFGIYTTQDLTLAPGGANTVCGQNPPGFQHADITGDAIVNSLDYSFIANNFLMTRDNNCNGSTTTIVTADGSTGSRDRERPITSLTIAQLGERGLSNLAVMDLNHDGVLDVQDKALWEQGVRPNTGGTSAPVGGSPKTSQPQDLETRRNPAP